MSGYLKKGKILAGLIVAFFTFFIALLASIGSELLMKTIKDLWIAILLLLIIIAIGIFFDTIGTAATAANLPPFNAKAAKKVFGAYQAVKITKNAGRVANYCNDVIGDIAGTLSGAVGAGIVFNLVHSYSLSDSILTGAVMTSFIAAVTVGGKSLGKDLAIAKANSIIFEVAKALGWWENLTGLELFKDRR